MNHHKAGQAAYLGMSLHVQVPDHRVRSPPAQQLDGGWVDSRAKEGGSASGAQ